MDFQRITPQGSATALHIYSDWPLAQFKPSRSFLSPAFPAIQTPRFRPRQLKVGDVIGVHTNGAHWAKVIVTATTTTSITRPVHHLRRGCRSTGSGNGGPPTITAMVNNSSGISAGLPNYGIAPSSIFVVIGTGLADRRVAQTAVQRRAWHSADAEWSQHLRYGERRHHSSGDLLHQPHTDRRGSSRVHSCWNRNADCHYKGVASKPHPSWLCPPRSGINTYYTNSGVATDAVTGALLSYTNSGTPGENIVLWTTGLGADPADSDTTFTSTPHAVKTVSRSTSAAFPPPSFIKAPPATQASIRST